MPDSEIDSLLNVANRTIGDLYEDAPCGFIFTNKSGLLVKANQTFFDWIGLSKDQAIGKVRFQDILSIGSKIYYETNFAPLLKMQGFLSEVTVDLKSADGTTLPVLINSTEIKNPDGEALLIRSTLFNITDRRQYERELINEKHKARESENRFKLLAKVGDEFRHLNQFQVSLEKLAKMATEDFCDSCSIELLQNDKLVRIVATHKYEERSPPAFRYLIELSEVRWPIFISDLSDNNIHLAAQIDLTELIQKYDPQSVIVVPILSSKRMIGTLSFYVTELGRLFDQMDLDFAIELGKRCADLLENLELHKANDRAAVELKESHDWLSTTLKSIGDAVIAVSKDKKISFLNEVATSLTGWSVDDAIGRPLDEVFKIINAKTNLPAFDPVEHVLNKGSISSLANDTALIQQDGRRIIIEDSAAPIKNSRGEITGVVLVFRNTTEKHLEDLARKQNLQLLQDEREIREKFVATLTHDLRSPLTAIKMNAQIILRQLNRPDVVEVGAQRVINGVDRTDKMIQDLLDASKVRAGGRLPIKIDRCELVSEIKKVLIELTVVHGDRFAFSSEPKIEGFWDCTALRRIIENLCSNAVKYGAPKLPIEVEAKKTDNGVLLSVHNEGAPISKDDQQTVFEQYRRTRSAATSDQKGWGLGLTLVRGMAEAHGGVAFVESSIETGTTFYVRLPLDARILNENSIF